jgi:hypothetical protein
MKARAKAAAGAFDNQVAEKKAQPKGEKAPKAPRPEKPAKAAKPDA